MKPRLIAALLLSILTGCDTPNHDDHASGAHNHAEGEEHDHSGDDEHVDRSQHLVHFNKENELFLQYETLVANRDSVFLVHFTRLSDYKPVAGGYMSITLSGGGAPDETFTGKRPVRAGIHIEVALPQHAGKRQLAVTLHTPTITSTHALGTVTVYPTYAASKNIPPRKTPPNTQYVEKEAQWKAGFQIRTPTVDAQNRLTLPPSAIHRINEENFIYVMHGAEFFERRAVHLAANDHSSDHKPDHHLVIDKGITASEHVVVKGGHSLLSDNELETTTPAMPDDAAEHHH